MKKHQLTDQVKLLQKAVLVDGDQFLILKRAANEGTRPEKWDLPGGNVEWEESSEDVRNPHRLGLIREIKEETGLEIAAGLIKSTNNCYAGTYFTAARDGEDSNLAIILGWRVELPEDESREIEISEEHTEYKWIGIDEFDNYDFGFAGEKDGFIREMVFNAFQQPITQ